MLNVTLLVALPDEYRYFKRATGPWQIVCRRPFRKFRCSVAGKQLNLVETGMGRDRANLALRWMLKENQPDIVCSFGFAGSINREFQIGQVTYGSGFVLSDECNEGASKEVIRLECSAEAWLNFCQTQGLRAAQIVTEERPESKRLLGLRFRETSSVVDMESYFIARFTQEKGIPFVCFRAISDGFEDEIDFDLGEITTEGRVKVAKVLRLLAQKPHLLPRFYSLWRKSTQAARELGQVVSAFVGIPSSTVDQFISQCRLTKIK